MASELTYCYAVPMDGLHEPISQHTRTLAGNDHQVRYEDFQPSTPISEDCIDVAFEIDFDYFQRQGGEFVTSSSEETSCTEGPHIYGEEEVKQCLGPRRRRKQKVTTEKAPKKTSRTRAPIRPSQRNAANARERSRMRVLSKAFTKLKTSLPWVPADTKLSKLDTLRLASCYIAHLQRVLQNENDNDPIHPVNLTWPFAAGIRHQSASHSSSSSSSSSEGSSLS